MLKNCDKILTVSFASARQLQEKLDVKDNNKITVVGCCNANKSHGSRIKSEKIIDFLCVGRFEKFCGLEDIWNTIKSLSPESKFVVIGRIHSRDLVRIRRSGIDHREIVSEEEKMQFYSKAKVFVFPSIYEGFGMAISEALAAGLSVVAWRLPVFEERFGYESNANVKLIELGRTDLFAKEVLNLIKNSDRETHNFSVYQANMNNTKTWDDVGKNVVSVLNSL
jgi:glycosyltransferase involved in cell wall biosynthesis